MRIKHAKVAPVGLDGQIWSYQTRPEKLALLAGGADGVRALGGLPAQVVPWRMGPHARSAARRVGFVENILNILMINYMIMNGWLVTANGSYQVPLHPTNCPLGMYYIYVNHVHK
jgi:hypothetical protein